MLFFWGKSWKAKAKTDFLTGLANHRAFNEILPSKLGCGYYFMLIDLCSFSDCNKKYGYSGADKILQKFAEALVRLSGKGDLLFRYRFGDEFAVLSPQGEKHLLELITNLRDEGFESRHSYCKLKIASDVIAVEKNIMLQKS